MQIDRIRHFAASDYPVLSVYLNRPEKLRGRTSVSALLTDLLRPIREMEDTGGLSHEAAMSLRSDRKTIQGLADRIEADTAPAIAVFACHGAGLFEYVPLDRPAWDVAIAAGRPYLRPLRATQMPFRSAAVVLEKHWSRVFYKDGERFEEYGEVREEQVRKANYGGFSGYAERGVRGHADQVVHRNFKETADLVFRLYQEEGFDFLFLGGHQETVDEAAEYLHPYVRQRYMASFVVDPHTMTLSSIRDQVGALEMDGIAAYESSRIQELLDTAGSSGSAVLGLNGVLAASNAKAIDRLIVSGNFTKPGAACDACGWLSRNGSQCPVCGAATRRTDDVVAEIIEATLQEGGEVLQVSVASALDGEAIGGMLRFPLPTGIA